MKWKLHLNIVRLISFVSLELVAAYTNFWMGTTNIMPSDSISVEIVQHSKTEFIALSVIGLRSLSTTSMRPIEVCNKRIVSIPNPSISSTTTTNPPKFITSHD